MHHVDFYPVVTRMRQQKIRLCCATQLQSDPVLILLNDVLTRCGFLIRFQSPLYDTFVAPSTRSSNAGARHLLVTLFS